MSRVRGVAVGMWLGGCPSTAGVLPPPGIQEMPTCCSRPLARCSRPPGVNADEQRWVAVGSGSGGPAARDEIPRPAAQTRGGPAPAPGRAVGPRGRGPPHPGVGPGGLRQDDGADRVAGGPRPPGCVALAGLAGQRRGRLLDISPLRAAHRDAGKRRRGARAASRGADAHRRRGRHAGQRARRRRRRCRAGARRLPRRGDPRDPRPDGVSPRASAAADPPRRGDPRRPRAAVGPAQGTRRSGRGPC
jgi:hypothetical protein